MAKKRKSSTSSGPRIIDPNDAKVNPISTSVAIVGNLSGNKGLTFCTDTWEDIPDEEDDFHISRDKVMLDGENYGRKGSDGTFQSLHCSRR